MAANSRLIVALDMYDMERAIDVASKTSDVAFAFKVNWPLVMAQGVKAIEALSHYGRVLCDFKLADIPNTNVLITKKARLAGGWGIISHSAVGRDSLQAVVHNADGMKVFSVVYMSHPGWADILGNRLLDLIAISKSAGADGLIGPGNEPSIIRKIRQVEKYMPILAPGIGTQGGSARDAIDAGADFIIVGRSIYSSESPRESAKSILESISEFGSPERSLA
ncbi:MAG: orotidine-5'-phosphate decarboxylase [Thermoplasmataceae archaeon]